eukprot:1896774-Karenia_brevis.AAC.1
MNCRTMRSKSLMRATLLQQGHFVLPGGDPPMLLEHAAGCQGHSQLSCRCQRNSCLVRVVPVIHMGMAATGALFGSSALSRNSCA